jgi:ABC-type branched-subunit amino acid transport system ATPase component
MNPVRPDIVNSALRKHLGLSTRAEDIGRYGELFVDPNVIDSVRNNVNQVVFGKRGSGKTSLLGYLTESFELDDNVIVFNLSATDFFSVS